jgi:hypothetical protein
MVRRGEEIPANQPWLPVVSIVADQRRIMPPQIYGRPSLLQNSPLTTIVILSEAKNLVFPEG